MSINDRTSSKNSALRSIGLSTSWIYLGVIGILLIGQSSFAFPASVNSKISTSGELISQGSNLSIAITNQTKADIESFLQSSDTVHDIVQEEVGDSLDRFTWLLGLFATITGVFAYMWIKQSVRNEIQPIMKDMESEFKASINEQSLKLVDATSGLLGLFFSIESIQFLSDLSFNPVSSESIQAVENYPEILERFKENFNIRNLPLGLHVKLGDVLALLGKHHLIQADSNHSEEDRKKANQEFNQAKEAYDEALKSLKALKSKVDEKISIDYRLWAEVLCKKGNTLAAIGEYSRAIAEYDDALKIYPEYYWAVHSQGDAFTKLGKYDEAIRKYKEALKISKVPESWHAETHYKIGIVYATQHDEEKAENSYRISLNLSPNNSWVLHSLGDVLRNLGDYKAAVEHYRKALDIKPRQYQSLRALGDALYEMGGLENYREAIQHYQRASEIASEDGTDDYEIQQKLGDVYLCLEEYASAVHHYSKAIEELKTDSFRAWACRAYAREQELSSEFLSHEEQEEYKKLITSDRSVAFHMVNDKYHRLLSITPGHTLEKAIIHYERSICHALTHDKENAIRELAEAIQLNKNCTKWAKKEIGFIAIQADPKFRKLLEESSSLPVSTS